jgi:hypothetical protein
MDFLHGISLCCILSRNYQKLIKILKGVFIERLEDEFVSIGRRIFANQYNNRLLVKQIKVTRKTGSTG